MKKRFQVNAGASVIEAVMSAEADAIVKEFQAKNISPIELIDNEKGTTTLFRKGTHDRNYFVRTKDLQPSIIPQSEDSSASDSDTGDNPDTVPEVQEVVKPRKSRSIKKQ